MTRIKINFSRIAVSMALIMALMGAVFILAACDDTLPPNHSIAGTYTYESVEVQASDPQPWMQIDAAQSVLTLNSDFTGIFTFQDVNSAFTYSRVGNNVTVSIVFQGQNRVWYGVLNGSKLTLEVRFNAHTMLQIVYKKS